MGLFLAVTAFQTADVDLVSSSIVEYSKKHGVDAAILDGVIEPNEKRHALIYGPVNGWTLVLWPAYFNVHDAPIAKAIAENSNVIVSTINIYDGDYWCHGLYSSKEQIDSFCSNPNYWADNEETATESKSQLQGSPEKVAAIFGINPDRIKGYYTHLDFGSDSGKVNDADEFELSNIWVFVDFWHAIGISYPENVSNFNVVVDLTTRFSNRLPQGGV